MFKTLMNLKEFFFFFFIYFFLLRLFYKFEIFSKAIQTKSSI